MSKQLTPDQSERLRNAIMEAYLKPEDFSEMLRIEELESFERYTAFQLKL